MHKQQLKELDAAVAVVEVLTMGLVHLLHQKGTDEMVHQAEVATTTAFERLHATLDSLNS